MTFVSLTINV